jgi:hypothetical protein
MPSPESPFIVCQEPPTDSALAIESPEGGMHGHGPAIVHELFYWQDRCDQAEAGVDLATYQIAKAFSIELSEVSWLADGIQGKMTFASMPEPGVLIINAVDASSEAAKRFVERDRRRALGVVALSKLIRLFLGEDGGPVETVLEDGIGHNQADMIVDIMAKDSVPLPVRIHMRTEHIDTYLGASLEGDALWFQRPDDGLMVKRTPLAITDPMRVFIDKHELKVDETSLQTVYPYLPARKQ